MARQDSPEVLNLGKSIETQVNITMKSNIARSVLRVQLSNVPKYLATSTVTQRSSQDRKPVGLNFQRKRLYENNEFEEKSTRMIYCMTCGKLIYIQFIVCINN